jgi:tetratricopeptide (TPR) repeat protein
VDLDKAISIQPKLFEAYNNRGSIRHDLGNLQGALADFNLAIKINSHSFEPLYLRGYVRIALKDFDGALVDFNAALHLSPAQALIYQGRGTAWMFKGRWMKRLPFNTALDRIRNCLGLLIEGWHYWSKVKTHARSRFRSVSGFNLN